MRSVSSLPSGTFSHAPLSGELMHAVELQVEQLADAQPARPLEEQSASAARRYSGRSSGLARRRSASTRQVTRERAREGRGTSERKISLRAGASLPAPFGDVGEEVRHHEDAPSLIGSRDHLAVLLVDRRS